MAFTYSVPLSVFNEILDEIDPSFKQEVTERLRMEIHADLSRRMIGPDIGTPTGWARTFYDSSVAHGDIIFYSPMDYEQVLELTGAPRPTLSHYMFAKESLMKDPEALLLLRDQRWRFPGDAGNGIFAASVNAVLARADEIKREYKKKSEALK